MQALTKQDLFTLEDYEANRDAFRARVIEHKNHRRLSLGEHVVLLFEDRLTMQYQVQEMLRTEKIFTAEGITEELAAYNPLIPDGTNWKATMMIEYPNADERRVALEQLLGIERQVWLQAGDTARIVPIADEDLERSTDTKTSAVHFLRFELTPEAVAALRGGASLRAGSDHPQYRCDIEVPETIRESLIADLA